VALTAATFVGGGLGGGAENPLHWQTRSLPHMHLRLTPAPCQVKSRKTLKKMSASGNQFALNRIRSMGRGLGTRHVIISLVTLITATTHSLHAATFTVTTTNISGPGSLAFAIAEANAAPGDNQILFSVTDPMTLGVALPSVTNNVAIIGRTDVPTVISGGGHLPLFAFGAGTTNTLAHLVLENGQGESGAAIYNSGTLSVLGC
jgi:hypothetical protein